MCGFAGVFLSQGLPKEVKGEWLEPMASALAPRGPDGGGDWIDPKAGVAITFRRLAIQDLSEAGHQPMCSRSGRWVISFNGEIYNHFELRSGLQGPWRGTSDTETLLALIEQRGLDATLPRLNGMFSFVVWDRQERQLTLVRDRMGIKPLYLARWNGGVAFGSELKALRVLPGLGEELDLESLRAFLAYLYVPSPRTPYRDVQKFPAGHRLTLNRSTDPRDPSAWWNLTATAQAGSSMRQNYTGAHGEARALEDVESTLRASVRRRLLADVPVGCLLSGGIDSTLITALAAEATDHPIKTFTVGFDSGAHNEAPYARQIAATLGTDHHEFLLSDDQVRTEIPRLNRIFDEPFANPSNLPTFLISQVARQSVTVALSGDGGDELFAGYNRYLSGPRIAKWLSRIPSPLRRVVASDWSDQPLRTLMAGWRALGADRTPRLLDEKLFKIRRMARERTPAGMYATLLTQTNNPDRFLHHRVRKDTAFAPLTTSGSEGGVPTLDELLLHDQLTYLPDDLLFKVDRSSMAVGLEVRVPMLDHELVKLSWQLPDRLKLRNGRSKYILRALAYRTVSPALLDREKVGFTVPIASWLRGSLKTWAEGLLFDCRAPSEPLLNRPVVEQAWNRFQTGNSETSPLLLWSLVQLRAWHSEHVA